MASLNPNTAILGIKNAKHLLRRATFVYTKALIDQYSKLTPTQALDLLLIESTLPLSLPYDPLPTTAPDGFWTESTNLATSFSNQYGKGTIVAGWWWYNAINTPTLKFKLSHFLSTRFTIIKNPDVFSSATDFKVFITCPKSFFWSFGIFLNSVKSSFNKPLLPKYLTRNFSKDSLFLSLKALASSICSFILSIISILQLRVQI